MYEPQRNYEFDHSDIPVCYYEYIPTSSLCSKQRDAALAVSVGVFVIFRRLNGSETHWMSSFSSFSKC